MHCVACDKPMWNSRDVNETLCTECLAAIQERTTFEMYKEELPNPWDYYANQDRGIEQEDLETVETYDLE